MYIGSVIILAVLDTSILFQHWFLKGPNFELIHRFNELSGSKLILPAIVVEETANKYREKLHESFERSTASLKKLKGLLFHHKVGISQPHIDVKTVSDEYSDYLRKRIMELNIETPGYNEIPHEAIIQRALESRKPFQKSGKGYRDSLIWETILRQVANKEIKTIYITDNTNDFGAGNGILHSQLQEDLVALDLPPDCVELCDSLEAFVNTYVKPSLSSLDEAKSQLVSGTYHDFSITKWIEDHTDDIQENLTRSVQSLIDDATLGQMEITDPTLTSISGVQNIIIEDVYEIHTEKVYIELSFEAEVGLDLFIEKSDYYGRDIPFQIMVWDEDWNEYYVWATASLDNIPVSLTLLFNLSAKEVESLEARFLNFFGLCQHCGAVIGSDAADTCPRCGRGL